MTDATLSRLIRSAQLMRLVSSPLSSATTSPTSTYGARRASSGSREDKYIQTRRTTVGEGTAKNRTDDVQTGRREPTDREMKRGNRRLCPLTLPTAEERGILVCDVKPCDVLSTCGPSTEPALISQTCGPWPNEVMAIPSGTNGGTTTSRRPRWNDMNGAIRGSSFHRRLYALRIHLGSFWSCHFIRGKKGKEKSVA